MTPSYTEFVRSRVKWLATPAEDLHHASTGIMGEIMEFEDALTSENRAEELGDWGFYMVHMQLALQKAVPNAGPSMFRLFTPEMEAIKRPLPITALMHNARCEAGHLLDGTKKLWIYNKPLDVHSITGILGRTRFLHDVWHQLCETLGLNIFDVAKANQAKLERRYPTGYSDAAAQARADKAGDQS